MMKAGFLKKKIYPVIFMFLITVVFITIVSGIFLSTKEIVEINEFLYLQKAVLYAAGIDLPESIQDTVKLYEDKVKEVKNAQGQVEYYQINYDENSSAFGVIQAGPGLWGTITSIVVFGDDYKTFKGVDFISQNETPGLGARIKEIWFKEQFRGKQGPFTFVPEGTEDSINQFDGLTGATRTTNGILGIVNAAPKTLNEKLKLKNGGE